MLRYRSKFNTKTVVNEIPQNTSVTKDKNLADPQVFLIEETSLKTNNENVELQRPPTPRAFMDIIMIRKYDSFFLKNDDFQ